jgi:hypothetical protein
MRIVGWQTKCFHRMKLIRGDKSGRQHDRLGDWWLKSNEEVVISVDSETML